MINNKKVIGIVGRHKINKEDPFEDCYVAGSSYIKQLNLEKVVPISVLLGNELLNFDTLDLCDAFILPGGNAVQRTTYYLIDYAIKHNKPVLGICLGAQAIAIYSLLKDRFNGDCSFNNIEKVYYDYKKECNGVLLEPIPKPNIHDHDKLTENCYHKIKIDKDSIAYDILKKEELTVTSFHGYEFRNIGSDFRITGRAEDGINEIVEYNKEPLVIGFQFHPEYMDTEIFNYFIDRIDN